MSDQIEETTETSPDELTLLKERAKILGINHHPSIGLEKLKAKINKAQEEPKPVVKQAPVVKSTPVTKKTPQQLEQERLSKLRREAGRLRRVRITCMNPNKKDWEGEIFTFANSVVGTHKKFVPFNTPDGWHVPQVILNMILERECQIFVTVKGPRGNKIRQGKLVKEFAVEFLDPLTEKELADLAKQQALANNLS